MVETTMFSEEEKPKFSKKALTGDLAYAAAKSVAGLALKTFANLKIEGQENVPLIGKAIIATISKDPIQDMMVITQITGRKIHFMVNHKLMRHKVAGPIFKTLGMFRSTMNKEDTEPIDKVFEILNEKMNLCGMTVESKYGREVHIKSMAGIIKFAIAAKAPIIPVAVSNESTKLFNMIPIKGKKIKVGTPLQVERKLNRDRYRDQRYELAEDIVDIIEALRRPTIEE